jgi:hypothetical protein
MNDVQRYIGPLMISVMQRKRTGLSVLEAER